MSRWFRFYDDVLNDPKILRMPEALRWHWVAMLCVASKSGGKLPHVEDCALLMRLTVSQVEEILSDLASRELIDEVNDGLFAPHNWKNRQYKSDTSTERVATFRKREKKRKRNVSVTPPENTETDSEPNGSDADASVTPEAKLWSEGLPLLISLGVKEKQARPMIGRWLRDCGNDHAELLRLLSNARQQCPAEPISWITASLKPRKDNDKSVHAAASSLVERMREFDEPAGYLRGGEGAAVVRMLPKR